MKIIISILLLICLLDMPYGYFQFVRFVTAAYCAYELITYPDNKYKTILIILLILFQPFFKISLGRTIWNLVDVAVAGWLLFFYSPSNSDESH